MQEFESTGLWWLPGQEAGAVAGTLKVSNSGNLLLSLIGRLGSVQPKDLSKTHDIILGSVEKTPFGNDVTLTECRLTGTTFGSFMGMRERYHASRGYFGAHLSEK